MKKIFDIKNKAVLIFGATAIASSIAFSPLKAQTVTGLSDFTIYLDPGHALKENQGLYNYSEAEKTLRVGLAVRDFLQTHTDIKTVYMCRQDDNTQISLTARTDEANALNVDFYYSMHSDAGTPTTNTTLYMYGGWAVDGVAIEKDPAGGKAFGEALSPDLTGVMRIPTRGLYADRMYYDNSSTHTNRYPYLSVNRESNMASLLSEAGYHTNPTQQQRNLNAEWKRMEGLSAFRSILEYMNVQRPDLGFLAGIITDQETGTAINGATVTIASKSKTYTTDTYQSLFNKYSNKPDELHNGFYFIEGLNNGDVVDVEYSAPGYQSQTKQITIATNPSGRTVESLNFTDIQLLNLTPAKVSSISATNLNSVSKFKPLEIIFDREMDKASVEAAINFTPNAAYTVTWKDNYTLRIDLSNFDYLTTYTLTIDGSIAKNTQTNNFLDGNADGTEGGNYVLTFKTAEQDSEAPYVVSYDPANGSTSTVARPIIRIQFNEPIEASSIALDQIKVTSNGNYVDGVLKHTVINKRSVLHYLFNADLDPEVTYNVKVEGGLQDLYGNEIAGPLEFSFNTKPKPVSSSITIDDFTTVGAWWNPSGSGSTTGIVTDASLTTVSTETHSIDSPTSLKMSYQWDENKTIFRIRLYRNSKTPKFTKDYIMQAYVFGDASNANVRLSLRDANGIKSHNPIKVDWAGWKLISWDLTNDPNVAWLAGTAGLAGTEFNFENVGWEAPTKPTDFSPSFIYVDDLRVVKLNTYTSIENQIEENDESITIGVVSGAINVVSSTEIKEINVYTLSGTLVKQISPKANEYTINDIAYTSGVYVVNVITGTSQKTEKVVIR